MLKRGHIGPISALLVTAALILPAAAGAAFPGANGRIAFDGDAPAGAESNVYSMNPDGTGKVNLTATGLSSQQRGTATGNYDPAFSADGERIVYERVEPGVFRPDIWVMSADGSGKTNLTQNTVNDRETDPSFSPDGSKIVYVREPDSGTQAIYVMNANGSAPTDLTSSLPITSPGAPEFSPDGTKIAFDASSGVESEIYVMNANGSGLTNVTAAVAGNSSSPSFSPDGSRIAFAHSDGMGRTDVFVIGAGGGATTNLTGTLPAGTQSDNPAFSPDGSRIAYRRTDTGVESEIFTMGSSDGLGQTNLTTDQPAFSSRPNWGPVDADAPIVTIGKKPKKKTGKRTAKFTFIADEAGVSFECKLSGKGVAKRFRKFKDCGSPRTYRRLKAGKKKFQVRAIDPAGNVGKQATFTWKIKPTG